MNANLRYWQAVLKAAEAELDAAVTLTDLRSAARRLVRARRQVAQLSASQPRKTRKRRYPSSRDRP